MFKFSKWTATSKELAVAFIGTLALCALSAYVPVLNLRYFEVIVHEICHCITCILWGGSVSEIMVISPISGYSMCNGGNQATILSAGYIGTSIVGALLIYFANRTTAKYILFLGVVFLTLFGLTIVKQHSSPIPGINSALTLAAILVFTALSRRAVIKKVASYVLGFSLVFYTIESLYIIAISSAQEYSNDAVEFTKTIPLGLSHQWISIAWILVCVYFLYTAIYSSIWVHRRTKRAEPA